MNRLSIYFLLLSSVLSIRSIAQTYSYQVIDDGCTKDTVQVMKWPDSVPSQFHNLLCFDQVRKMRLHSREINLELPNQMVKTAQFTQRHHNVGVYFSKDRGGLKSASLHEFGLGTIDFISNPKTDGYYLVLSENNGRRRSVMYQMRRGDLIMYRSKTCEARIHKFPANGLKVKRT